MPQYSSYVICGTPRSGSTLLCEMLAATGVAGRPNSFFRSHSILYWAERWGMEPPHELESDAFDRAYLAAMLQYGRAGTTTFGLRIMWGSVDEASTRLNRVYGGHADVARRFEEAFGPTLYIHLSRRDKVAQAVSLVRAEQSGLWHLNADGSVYEGNEAPLPVVYDGDRLSAVLEEREADDAAWTEFFPARQIEPLRLTYETMTASPQQAVADILSALGKDPTIAKGINVGTRKMSDEASREWAARLREQTRR